jgi:hypothetical protein
MERSRLVARRNCVSRKVKVMRKVLMTGHAEWGEEAFDFEVGEWSDGIGLMMRHAGYGDPKSTGAGIWPTIEKAKEIADQTVKRLLSPQCSITWTETAN